MQNEKGIEFAVDLKSQTVTAGEDVYTFEIDEFRKYCMLNGFDDIGLTLQHADLIKAYEQERKHKSPWLF